MGGIKSSKREITRIRERCRRYENHLSLSYGIWKRDSWDCRSRWRWWKGKNDKKKGRKGKKLVEGGITKRLKEQEHDNPEFWSKERGKHNSWDTRSCLRRWWIRRKRKEADERHKTSEGRLKRRKGERYENPSVLKAKGNWKEWYTKQWITLKAKNRYQIAG